MADNFQILEQITLLCYFPYNSFNMATVITVILTVSHEYSEQINLTYTLPIGLSSLSLASLRTV